MISSESLVVQAIRNHAILAATIGSSMQTFPSVKSEELQRLMVKLVSEIAAIYGEDLSEKSAVLLYVQFAEEMPAPELSRWRFAWSKTDACIARSSYAADIARFVGKFAQQYFSVSIRLPVGKVG